MDKPEVATAEKITTEDPAESDDDESRTLFVGNLSPDVTDEILYELFLQAGPINEISIPKDRETKKQKSFGFVLYRYKEAVEYAASIFEGIKLYGRELRIRNRKGGNANGPSTPQPGLERLSGYNRQNSDGGGMNHQNMLPNFASHSSNMTAASGVINPMMFMAMGEQMIQNLSTNNPFAMGLGQFANGGGGGGNDRGRDRGPVDRGSWMHGGKPYERRRNGYNNEENRGKRGRSRSRERRRSRSRSRDRQNKRRRR